MSTTIAASHLFEEDIPLDKSVLWSWIRQYYSQGGVEVWSEGDVPFHITNTPLLAQEWARSIICFLRDFVREGQVDGDFPIEVFELGVGTGRHGYFLWRELQRLEPLTAAFFPGGLKLRLHLAELGESGLQSLANHPTFARALAEGSLMLHQFDIDSDFSPRGFPAGNPSLDFPSPNPSFVITNYILDSLPHDVIRIADGKAQLGLIKLTVRGLAEGQKPTDLADLGERIQLSFNYDKKKLKYDAPFWQDIVNHYEMLRGETHIPFPTSSLRLAERARNWSKVATVFLVADKSFTSMDQLVELEEPELVAHGGGFSFNANLHGFGLLARKLGGICHHTGFRDGTLDLSHVVFPGTEHQDNDWDFLESEFRFTELENFHAVDRFRAKESVDELGKSYSLRCCLDLFRLSGFDPQVFYELSDDMLDALEADEEGLLEMEDELADVLPRCLSMIFPLPDDVDVAFEIGRVAYRMETYPLAERAFKLSLEQYGDDPRTYFNLGLTWFYREQWKKALKDFKNAVKLDPEYEEARHWMNKTKVRIAGR